MVWLKETGQYALKYHAWPNPFRNQVKKLQVLACEDTWQAKVEMYKNAFGFWFWDSFIPSPVELTRKFALGSYKCGFYIPGLKTRSPLDIVWRDGRTSRMLLEIARPVTTGLWAMWAAETIWSALSTWSSIQYLMEMCETDRYMAMLRDGDAPLPPGVHQGGPVFGTVMWDPNEWIVEANCTVVIPEPKNVHALAFGYLRAESHQVNSCRISINDSADVLAYIDTGPIEPNGVFAWDLEYANEHGAGALFIVADYDIAEGGLLNSRIVLTRFTVRETPLEIPLPDVIGGPQDYTPPPVPCDTVQAFYDSLP